jgi:hypothetical protein
MRTGWICVPFSYTASTGDLMNSRNIKEVMSIKDFKEEVVAYIKVNTTWKGLHENVNYNVQYID